MTPPQCLDCSKSTVLFNFLQYLEDMFSEIYTNVNNMIHIKMQCDL